MNKSERLHELERSAEDRSYILKKFGMSAFYIRRKPWLIVNKAECELQSGVGVTSLVTRCEAGNSRLGGLGYEINRYGRPRWMTAVVTASSAAAAAAAIGCQVCVGWLQNSRRATSAHWHRHCVENTWACCQTPVLARRFYRLTSPTSSWHVNDRLAPNVQQTGLVSATKRWPDCGWTLNDALSEALILGVSDY